MARRRIYGIAAGAFFLLAIMFALVAIAWRQVDREKAAGTQSSETTGPEAKSVVRQRSENNWTVTVDSKAWWFDTNIQVNSGDRVDIHATGSVRWNPRPPAELEPLRLSGTVGPDGTRPPYENLKAPFPMPDVAIGALVMRVGDVKYAVGSDRSITISQSGTIELMVNDDDRSDNSGSFTAYVEVKRRK